MDQVFQLHIVERNITLTNGLEILLKIIQKLFNLGHFVARNAIERAFGLLKKRWSILRSPSFFDHKTQVRIINACCIIHKFLRIEQLNNPVLELQDLRLLAIVDNGISNKQIVEEDIHDAIINVQVTDAWTTYRDTITLQMFYEYQTRRNTTNMH